MQNIPNKHHTGYTKERWTSTEKILSGHSSNKGQAAVEFLLTYGWAILGALIVIGALSYFGIFNTQKYVRDTCYFGDQMMCEDYIAYNDGNLSVTLRNNFGANIDVTAANIISDFGRTGCIAGPLASWNNLLPGATFEINCDITSGTLSVNNKVKYKMVVTFRRTGSGNLHNQTGDATVTVQRR